MAEGRFELPKEPVAEVPAAAPATVPAAATPDSEGQKPAESAPAEEVKQEGAQTTPATPKTDEQPEKQGLRRFERRLDKAYRQLGEEKARRELLERQLEELKPKAQAPATSAAPLKIEDFNFDGEAFAKAVAAREREAITKELDVKQSKQREAEFHSRLTRSWTDQVAKGNEKYEDFDEIVGDIKPAAPWAVALMQAENAADVAYHLGKHISEAQRIISLDPVSQIYEIGRLGAKLAATPPAPKQASKAPAPIQPVAAVSTDTSLSPSENDDMKTWIKKRTKQVRGR